jgi:hypothetical protein
VSSDHRLTSDLAAVSAAVAGWIARVVA